MASTYTTNKSIEQPGNNDYINTWNVPVNADWAIIDKAFGGTTTLTGTSGTTTLIATEYQSLILVSTVTLTGNVTYRIPSGVGGQWVVDNRTTGAFTFTVSSLGGGTSVVCTQNARTLIFSDGTNVRLSTDTSVTAGTGITVAGSTVSLDVPVTAVRGGTGFTTYTTGDIIYASAANTLSKLSAGTVGYVLTLAGGVPTWAAPTGGGGGGGTVTSITVTGGTTGLSFTPATPITTSGTFSMQGTLAASNGGTGLTGFVAADRAVYSTSTSTLTAGTLPIAAGGTGAISDSGARTNLGLGSMATQAAGAVAITGGNITGLTSLRVSGQSYEAIGNGTLNVNANTSFFQNGTGLTHSASGTSNFTTTNTTFTLQAGITPQAFGTTVWVNISDARIKTDVTPYGLGTAALKQLRPVNYIYTGEYGTPDGGPVQTGLIAQEVLTTPLSSMVGTRVYTDPNTGVETTLYDVNTNQLVFALINAVKELDARVKALEPKTV
jgi:hypothetical protein